MIRVLVVDDEAPARSRLVRMLAGFADVEVAGEAEDGVAAREAIARLRPELVLLDVQMPGVDGLSLAAQGELPAIVFVTAHAEHAVRAFELAAVDYLLKPVTAERLRLAIDRARTRVDVPAVVLAAALDPAVPPKLAARDGPTTRLFDLAAITRLHAEAKYVVLVHEGREYLLDQSLVDLEHRLAPFGFLRVHRAELVNLRHVTALHEGDGARVQLTDGQTAPVSRRSLPELRRRLPR